MRASTPLSLSERVGGPRTWTSSAPLGPNVGQATLSLWYPPRVRIISSSRTPSSLRDTRGVSSINGGPPPGRAPLETRLLGWGGKASRGYRVCAAHSMDGGPEHKQQPAHLWGEARPKMQLEVWTMHWATLLPCDV